MNNWNEEEWLYQGILEEIDSCDRQLGQLAQKLERLKQKRITLEEKFLRRQATESLPDGQT